MNTSQTNYVTGYGPRKSKSITSGGLIPADKAQLLNENQQQRDQMRDDIATIKRLQSHADKLAEALRDLKHDIDCYDGMNAEHWQSFKTARQALADWEKSQ